MTNYLYKFSPYRAINTIVNRYKNQPVNAVRQNNRCLFSYPYKNIKKLCGQNVELFNFKSVVNKVNFGSFSANMNAEPNSHTSILTVILLLLSASCSISLRL